MLESKKFLYQNPCCLASFSVSCVILYQEYQKQIYLKPVSSEDSQSWTNTVTPMPSGQLFLK